jgi:hypothetical protein
VSHGAFGGVEAFAIYARWPPDVGFWSASSRFLKFRLPNKP